MTSLKWEDPSEKPASHAPASMPASSSDTWFGVAMGLVGVIVGYVIHAVGVF